MHRTVRRRIVREAHAKRLPVGAEIGPQEPENDADRELGRLAHRAGAADDELLADHDRRRRSPRWSGTAPRSEAGNGARTPPARAAASAARVPASPIGPRFDSCRVSAIIRPKASTPLRSAETSSNCRTLSSGTLSSGSPRHRAGARIRAASPRIRALTARAISAMVGQASAAYQLLHARLCPLSRKDNCMPPANKSAKTIDPRQCGPSGNRISLTQETTGPAGEESAAP